MWTKAEWEDERRRQRQSQHEDADHHLALAAKLAPPKPPPGPSETEKKIEVLDGKLDGLITTVREQRQQGEVAGAKAAGVREGEQNALKQFGVGLGLPYMSAGHGVGVLPVSQYSHFTAPGRRRSSLSEHIAQIARYVKNGGQGQGQSQNSHEDRMLQLQIKENHDELRRLENQVRDLRTDTQRALERMDYRAQYEVDSMGNRMCYMDQRMSDMQRQLDMYGRPQYSSLPHARPGGRVVNNNNNNRFYGGNFGGTNSPSDSSWW